MMMINSGGDRNGTYLGQQMSIARTYIDETKEMELSSTQCPFVSLLLASIIYYYYYYHYYYYYFYYYLPLQVFLITLHNILV